MIKLGLEKISEAAALIGNPQDSFKAIHIAGTNGKGSVCTWLELMFLFEAANKFLHLKPNKQASFNAASTDKSKLKIAKYISPHVLDITERISIDGQDISTEGFKALWQELYGASYEENAVVENISDPNAKLYKQSLTEFEKLTLLAFEYFKRKNVDLAIIEVGLGGRLDATNIIKGENTLATAITNISFDHQEYLGNSLEQIRKEKEGIIKTNVKHFEGTNTEYPPNSAQGANYRLAWEIYSYAYRLGQSQTAITSKHSSNNTCTNEHGNPASNNTCTNEPNTEAITIYKKLEHKFQKRYLARFQHICDNVIIDGAHNPAGALVLSKYLGSGPKIFIVGMLDKDHKGFFTNLRLKQTDNLIVTNINNPRACSSTKLAEIAKAIYPQLKIQESTSISTAIDLAKDLLKSNPQETQIVICGSLVLTKEAILKWSIEEVPGVK